MGFKRDARIWKQKMEEFVDVPYDYVKAQMARGEAHSSICSSILGQDGILLNAEQEFDLKWTANSMYGGQCTFFDLLNPLVRSLLFRLRSEH